MVCRRWTNGKEDTWREPMYPGNSGNTKFSQIFGFAVSCAPAVGKEGTKGTQVFDVVVSFATAVGKEGTHMSVLLASLKRMAHQNFAVRHLPANGKACR